jgi:hypothetical protein
MIVPDCLIHLQLENIYEDSKKMLSGLECLLIGVLKPDSLPEKRRGEPLGSSHFAPEALPLNHK